MAIVAAADHIGLDAGAIDTGSEGQACDVLFRWDHSHFLLDEYAVFIFEDPETVGATYCHLVIVVRVELDVEDHALDYPKCERLP